ncbi:MAG: ArsR/SmtB family transcription factor [bacterium]
MQLVEIIKALAHENRLRILNLLKDSSLCVCELENLLGISQSNASRHLKKLKNCGLISGRKQEQWVHYDLNEELLEKHSFIKQLLENEFSNQPLFRRDIDKLRRYNESDYTCENIDEADIF